MMFLRRVLKHLNFEYLIKSRNSALIERNDIFVVGRIYLELIKHFRLSVRPLYYFDETWVNAETKTKSWVDTIMNLPRGRIPSRIHYRKKKPSEKARWLIVLHIESSDGFVLGDLLYFESKKNTLDYHNEMNGDRFYY